MKTVVLFLLLLSSLCSAHEFWLEPESYQNSPGEPAQIKILVGMNFQGKPWKGNLKDLLELSLFRGEEKAEIPWPEEPVFEVVSADDGQALVGFTNRSAFIELPAKEFESYLKSEGLEQIVTERASLGESSKPGKELYRRCAKTLLEFGEGNSALSYDKQFGFPLELTPNSNPYRRAGSSELTFRVTHQSQPLVNAQVAVWHKSLGDRKKTLYRTDARGEVTFPFERRGDWLVTCVHMVRAQDDERADWQSYWGSYSFGF